MEKKSTQVIVELIYVPRDMTLMAGTYVQVIDNMIIRVDNSNALDKLKAGGLFADAEKVSKIDDADDEEYIPDSIEECLNDSGEWMSIKDIASDLQWTRFDVRKGLKELLDTKVVEEQLSGRSLVYRMRNSK